MRRISSLLFVSVILSFPVNSLSQAPANIQGSWAGTVVTGSADYGLLFLTFGQTNAQVLGSFDFVDSGGTRSSSKVYGSVTGTSFTFASDPFTDSHGCGNQVTQGNAT